MEKWRANAVVCLSFLLAFGTCALALDPSLDVSQYSHTAWRVRDGFGNGPLHSIAQTHDGYLWPGTESGLLRFDGARAVLWQPPRDEHLPSNVVQGLLVSSDGTLWIGTGKGLASWKDGKLAQYPEMAGWIVGSLIEDHEGTVWAGGFGVSGHGRLCAIEDGRPRCSDPGEGVQSIYEDSKNTLWVSTFQGLWRWKPQGPEFFSTGKTFTSGLIEDSDGGLLFGRANGIQRFVNGKTGAYPVGLLARQFGVNSFLRDRDGSLWVGTFEGLAHLHRGRADVFRQVDGLSGTTVHGVFEDREGTIWVATEGGLDRFRDFAVPTFSANQGFPAGLYGSILATRDGSLWFSTSDRLTKWKNSEMTVYDRRGSTTHAGVVTGVREIHDSGLPGQVRGLYQDSRGRLWITALGGSGYLENDKFVPIKAVTGETKGSIAEGADGDLWFSYQNALFHLVEGSRVEQMPWDTLGIKDVGGLIVGDPLQGGLWIGFPHGGIAYLRHGQIDRSYTAADGLGDGRISHLRLDPERTLWVSTEGGLSRIRDGHIATLSAKNGLPCDAVHWSEEDADHSVWLYLECGLARVAPSEIRAWASDPNRTVRLTFFDSSDGVEAKSVIFGGAISPVTKSLDGKLWFSVENGVSVVDPRHLSFNKLAPAVHVEQIVADDKAYDISSGLHLPSLIRHLEIDYTALSFVAPEKVLFRFKLEGLDRDWQEVGNRRQAYYTNLPPRHYRFRVAGCNNSGVWNEEGAVLDFAVDPAYWQTNWFRAVCVAALLGLLWMLHQFRVHQLAYRFNLTLEARVSERTRIARELHDTLLQSFQGLMLRFQSVDEMLPARPIEAKDALEGALDRADQAIIEGRDAISDIRTSTVGGHDLAKSMTALMTHLSEEVAAGDGGAVPFRVLVEGTPRTVSPILQEEIYRIARESLRNAFRHAQARNIETEITYDESRLRLRFRDDGKGIDPRVVERGGRSGHWGLPGMHERAKRIGAQLEVWSEVAAGTEVELSIPGSIAYETFPARRGFRFFRKRSEQNHEHRS
jgi:signal transduction histidine kinase/ligand-binding sensor domain-containing protein